MTSKEQIMASQEKDLDKPSGKFELQILNYLIT